MMSKNLIEKILLRIGETPEIRSAIAFKRYKELNERLNQQLESQKMTDEILNKRCTL